MESAARAVVGTTSVAPGDDPELGVAKRSEIRGTVYDVLRQRSDFLLHGRVPPGAGGVRELVVFLL
jgi:hypothetical protein